MLEIFLIYFSIVDKLEVFASLFIVMMTPLFVIQMKSAIMSDFVSFRHLLILAMCKLTEFTINLVFDFAIEHYHLFPRWPPCLHVDSRLLLLLTAILGLNHLSHFIS